MDDVTDVLPKEFGIIRKVSPWKIRLYAKLRIGRRISIRFWSAYYGFFLGGLGPNSRLARPFLVSGPERIFLADHVFIGYGSRLEAIAAYHGQRFDGRITIGQGTSIEPHVHIAACAHLHIGSHVLMGSRVFITDHDHNFSVPRVPIAEQGLTCAPVRIENRVWLGENVVVLKGVTIGHHAVIGANSVVTKDIPPFAVAAGVPAKVLRIIPGADHDEPRQDKSL